MRNAIAWPTGCRRRDAEIGHGLRRAPLARDAALDFAARRAFARVAGNCHNANH